MAKKTLLEIVQDILNDLDSDSVNSINDTIESQQVAQVVRSCYEEISSNRNWPHQKKLIQIDASGSVSKPNYLKLPDSIKEMVSFKYDCVKSGSSKIQYKDIIYKHPDEFLYLVNNRDNTLDNMLVVTDFSGIKLTIVNNQAPSYWTSFDDEYIVCDAYDSTIEATLQKSKTQVLAYVESSWVHEDDAIPDLPSEAFSLLTEESKSTAFLTLKQMANQKAEQKASRQNRWLSRKAWKAKGGVRYDDYGRKGYK
jgi:hypothetical protein